MKVLVINFSSEFSRLDYSKQEDSHFSDSPKKFAEFNMWNITEQGFPKSLPSSYMGFYDKDTLANFIADNTELYSQILNHDAIVIQGDWTRLDEQVGSMTMLYIIYISKWLLSKKLSILKNRSYHENETYDIDILESGKFFHYLADGSHRTQSPH